MQLTLTQIRTVLLDLNDWAIQILANFDSLANPDLGEIDYTLYHTSTEVVRILDISYLVSRSH